MSLTEFSDASEIDVLSCRERLEEALECLYDNVRLSRIELASLLPHIAAIQAFDERAESMRAAILEAIEMLRPARRLPFGALEARSYDVLTLRYVEGMSVERMTAELSLGRRQIYRDLEEAKTRLAEVLISWIKSGREAPEGQPRSDPVSDELQALASEPRRVDLTQIVDEAAKVVAPLLQLTQCQLAVETSGEPLLALADPSLLKQTLVQLLSLAAQAGTARANIRMQASGSGYSVVTLSFSGSISGDLARRLGDAQRIGAAQGIELSWDDVFAKTTIILKVPVGRPVSVMVVEDNPGAVELYRRYLSSENWQLHGVPDPRLAGEVARHNRPDVIVLDIMMPKLDGWSLLQSLRQDESTAHTPVIICSIIEDPALAAALGAQEHLSKPVSQGQFLAALRRCLSAPALHPPAEPSE